MKKKTEKEYCIIALDEVNDIKDDLIALASDSLKFIDSEKQTVFVATFKTIISLSNISDILREGGNKTFFIFEVNPKRCAIHIGEKHLHDILFKSLDEKILNLKNKKRVSYDKNEEKKMRLKEIRKLVALKNSKVLNLSEDDSFNEKELKNLNIKERNDKIDNLLNNASNLTNNEKKILDFLVSL